MKKILFLFSAIISVLIFYSCSDEERATKVDGSAVRLKAFFESAPLTRIGNAWSGTEHIGLFMIEADQFVPVDGIENKEYRVSAGDGNLLTPVEEEVFYPKDGRSVRFVAYYPYRSDLISAVYPVDLTDDTVADHDLLYAKNDESYNRDQAEAVSLRFVHQMVKLILNIQVERDQQVEPVVDWSASVHRYTKASFNLATGELSAGTDSLGIALPVKDGTGAMIILPGSHGKIVIVHEEKAYEWNTEGIDFKSGTQYTYKITLKPTDIGVIDPVQVQLVSSIQDWDKINEEITLPETEEEKKPTENPDEETGGEVTPVYESNVDLATVTAVSSTSVYQEEVVIENNNYPALKLGSTGKLGKTSQIKLGNGKTQLRFYAFAWNGQKSKLKISISSGATFDGKSYQTLDLQGNSGMNGISPYKIQSPQTGFYEYSLTGVTDTTTITLETLGTTGFDNRAVIFGINVE
ncbi:MAG: fimbrillin family protein [Bacteroidales bacterium]